jgi:hypothetical protein
LAPHKEHGNLIGVMGSFSGIFGFVTPRIIRSLSGPD